MYPSDAKAARERRQRAIRKVLHDHIESPEGCSCRAPKPAHRTTSAWWVEHVSGFLADT